MVRGSIKLNDHWYMAEVNQIKKSGRRGKMKKTGVYECVVNYRYVFLKSTLIFNETGLTHS